MIFQSPLLNRILFGVLIPFICLVGFVIYQSSILVDKIHHTMDSELQTTLDHVNHDLQLHQQMTRQAGRILARNADLAAVFDQRKSDLLYYRGKQLIDTGLISKATFVNENGIVLARSHDEFHFNDIFQDKKLFEKVKSGQEWIYLNDDESVMTYCIMIPVLQYDVLFKGFVMVEKDLTHSIMYEMAKGSGLETIAILPEAADPKTAGLKKPGFSSASRKLMLVDKNGAASFKLVVSKFMGDRIAQIHNLEQRILVLTCLMSLSTFVIIYFAIRRSLGPIRAMHALLNRFQGDRLSLPALIENMKPLEAQNSELGLIAKEFTKTLARVEHVQGNLEHLVGQRTRELEIKTNQLSEEIRERKKAEKEYRLVVENATEAIFLVQEGMVKFPNPRAMEMLNADEQVLQHKSFFDFVHPEDREKAKKRNLMGLNSESVAHPYSFRISTADGQNRWVQLNTVATLWKKQPATLNFMRDITDLRKAQQSLVQSEKMLSVGGLAAGMAHEINNPLAGMMQNAQVVINRLSSIDMPANEKAAQESGVSTAAIQRYMKKRKILRALDQINESGKQAAEIVRNMLNFVKKKDSPKSTYDVREILEKTLALSGSDYDLKRKYDFRNIKIKKELPVTPAMVLCEQSKIQQVFFNILKNAAEAMAEKPGYDDPCIELRVRRENDMVCIEIEDNGPGMDSKEKARIFEPFYTTKPVDKGTGLGLSIAYFIIVEDHGGSLEVQSRPRQGSCFIICLPLAGK